MTRVLVATSARQGERSSDFSWTVEGELVIWPFECDADREDIDGGCGCRRSWIGAASARATTTARVAELFASAAEYVEALRDSLRAHGWYEGAGPAEVAAIDADLEAVAGTLLDVAGTYPTGTVLERRGEAIDAR